MLRQARQGLFGAIFRGRWTTISYDVAYMLVSPWGGVNSRAGGHCRLAICCGHAVKRYDPRREGGSLRTLDFAGTLPGGACVSGSMA